MLLTSSFCEGKMARLRQFSSNCGQGLPRNGFGAAAEVNCTQGDGFSGVKIALQHQNMCQIVQCDRIVRRAPDGGGFTGPQQDPESFDNAGNRRDTVLRRRLSNCMPVDGEDPA